METSRIPPILDWRLIDERLVVLDEDAFRMARRLCQEEGMFMGVSAGTAIYAAAEVAKGMTEGTIVAVLPDRGDKYLTTSLFDKP
jgi:cysteine synthase